MKRLVLGVYVAALALLALAPGFGQVYVDQFGPTGRSFPATVNVTIPTHYWKLNEATGNFADSISTNAVTLTRSASVTHCTDGPFLSAASFDGVNGHYAHVADSATVRVGSGDWTLGWWAKATGKNAVLSVSIFAGKVDGFATAGWEAVFNNQTSNMEWFVYPGGAGPTIGEFPLNNYHFYMMRYVRSTTTLTLSRDGGVFGLASVEAFTDNTTDELAIGGTTGGGSNFNFQGCMARFGMWAGTALTNANAAALYNSGLGADPPLL